MNECNLEPHVVSDGPSKAEAATCYKCKSHTAFNLDGAVLAVQRVVVQVHHAGQGGREPHPVGDAAVAAQPHQLIALGHVVEETETNILFTT